jgi:hypothetical protein
MYHAQHTNVSRSSVVTGAKGRARHVPHEMRAAATAWRDGPLKDHKPTPRTRDAPLPF